MAVAATGEPGGAIQGPRAAQQRAPRSTLSRLGLLWRTHSGAEFARRGLPRAGAMRMDPAIVSASVLINLLGLAMPLAVLQIYDRIAPQQAYETLFALAALLLAVGLVEFGLRVAQGQLANLSAARFGHALQVLALRRLLSAPLGAPARTRPTETLERLRAVDRLIGFYGGHPRLSLIDLPFAFVFIAMIGVIAGPLALVPVVMVALFFSQISLLGRRNRDLAEARDTQDGRMADFLGEVLGGAFTVKSFAIEMLMLRRFERLLRGSAGLQRQAVNLAGDAQRAASVFGSASMVAMVAVGALFVVFGDLSVGGLAACSLLSGRATQPLLKAANAWTELERATLAIDKVADLYGLPEKPAPAVLTTAPRPPGVVAMDLALARGEQRPVADALFSVQPGAVAALIGSDGSGRSTLLAGAAGLLSPSSGALEIDGAPATAYRRAPTARIAAYGPNHRAFNATILQNLTLFGRGATVDDARWAAQLFGVEEAINLLPEGYDTMLGAGVAETLPTGLMRRLLMARAVAQRPRLLLLNRPTAFLDEASERRVAEALKTLRGHVTIFVATTARPLLETADLALTFDRGVVRELAITAVLNGRSALDRAVSAPSRAQEARA